MLAKLISRTIRTSPEYPRPDNVQTHTAQHTPLRTVIRAPHTAGSTPNLSPGIVAGDHAREESCALLYLPFPCRGAACAIENRYIVGGGVARSLAPLAPTLFADATRKSHMPSHYRNRALLHYSTELHGFDTNFYC